MDIRTDFSQKSEGEKITLHKGQRVLPPSHIMIYAYKVQAFKLKYKHIQYNIKNTKTIWDLWAYMYEIKGLFHHHPIRVRQVLSLSLQIDIN